MSNLFQKFPKLRPINNYQVVKQDGFQLPPQLGYDLSKVLSKKGPHKFQSKGTFYFDQNLHKLPLVEEMQMDKVSNFTRVSEDFNLHEITKKQNLVYCSSTSSINALLVPFFFLISDKKVVDTKDFSSEFKGVSNQIPTKRFSPFLRNGSRTNIKYKDGIYMIEAVSNDKSNILMELGHVLELFLTTTKEQFNLFKKTSQTTPELPQSYHFAKVGKMVLRSQLDSHHPSLDRKTFDVKTRAVMAIRNDLANYKENTWYEISKLKGLYESFEREHFDMIKNAYLKYSLQARIGNMDGIFIAYHNIKEFFGFQYYSLDEIEEFVHGSKYTGEQSFSLSIQLLDLVMDRIRFVFPEQDVEVLLSEPRNNSIVIIVQPLSKETSKSLAKHKNKEELDGQKPLVLRLTTHSTIDKKHKAIPIVTDPIQEWELYYELVELAYDSRMVNSIINAYEKLHRERPRKGGFGSKLKKLLRPEIEEVEEVEEPFIK
jgi:hypothetical protein